MAFSFQFFLAGMFSRNAQYAANNLRILYEFKKFMNLNKKLELRGCLDRDNIEVDKNGDSEPLITFSV